MTCYISVCSHTLQQQAALGGQASGDLTILLTAIQTTCKTIAMNVRRARLLDLWVPFLGRPVMYACLSIDSPTSVPPALALPELPTRPVMTRRSLIFVSSGSRQRRNGNISYMNTLVSWTFLVAINSLQRDHGQHPQAVRQDCSARL